MTLDMLKQRLFAEGYRPLIHELRPWGLMISDLYLEIRNDLFTVAWTERGEVTDTLHASHEEAAACQCFHDVVADKMWHFRTFPARAEADVLTARLTSAGITPWRNDIPNFNGPGDARYRIFVKGRDLARAEQLAGSTDTGNPKWTMAGLGLALLGIPAVTLCYRLAVAETTATSQLILRETAIFALLGMLILVIRRGERLPLSSIGLRTGRPGRALLWGLLAFLLLGIGTAGALGLLHAIGLTYRSGPAAFVPPVWATALVVLRAGVVEEICYRGYAIERIEALSGSRARAGMIPLIAFASFHFRQGIAGILIALILGAILTAFYFWKRNLAANIIGHFLIDFAPNVLLPAIGG